VVGVVAGEEPRLVAFAPRRDPVAGTFRDTLLAGESHRLPHLWLALEPGRFLLVVGTAKRTKNIGAVLDAWRHLPDRAGRILVWVGGFNTRVFADEAAAHTDRAAHRAEGIRRVGVIPDSQLKALYEAENHNATALALKFLELAPTEEVVVENPNAVVRDEQPQRVQDTFTADPRYAKRGRLTEFSNVAWQAELPPSEREALDQGARERYPERYAHDLSLYFEHLAGAAARARAQGGKP
jgi:hypothetical protein